MSDELDEDLLKGLGDLGDGGIEGFDGESGSILTEDAETPAVARRSSGVGRRLFGLLAFVLGVVGSLAMVLLAVLTVRFGFGASDAVDRALAPVESAFDRMESRIDQTDDLVDRDGIDGARVAELRARVDGLVDVSSGARQGFEAIEDHPIYSLLPAELSNLDESLAQFQESADGIESLLGSATAGRDVPATTADKVADEIDEMQARVSGVRSQITDAASSLRTWIRFGSFLGFLGALWGLWGQVSLAKRGWRRLRGG